MFYYWITTYSIPLIIFLSFKNNESQSSKLQGSITFPDLHTLKTPHSKNCSDKIVGTFINEGRVSHGRTVYVGLRGGHYTMTANYNKQYLTADEIKFSIKRI